MRLTNETEIEEISGAVRELICDFAGELAPFAAEICRQLRDSYVKLIEAESDDADDENNLKAFSAYGVLQAIRTLIYAVGSTPEVRSRAGLICHLLIWSFSWLIR